MHSESIKNLAKFRLEQAKESLISAEMDLQSELLRSAANRSYYCIFHSMRGVLALEGYDSKKHSGIISAFRQKYIKTGIFPTSFSVAIGNAFEVRNNSDYQDFYIVIKSDVTEQVKNAKIIFEAVAAYIDIQLEENR
ncbi:MAG: HEPN domain-containing protein [Defluviitaleaceae bacterium]|nr:HEPN domain-containing protein [Defluviitaleaceae bacterium]